MKDSKIMKHQGYYGSAEVNIEDGCLNGSIQCISDLVAYSGETVAELEHNFRDAVDGYIAYCKEIHREPAKPCSGTFNVRIGTDLHRSVVVAAKKAGATLNDFVKQTLQDKVDGKGNVENHVHIHKHPIVSSSQMNFPEEKQSPFRTCFDRRRTSPRRINRVGA